MLRIIYVMLSTGTYYRRDADAAYDALSVQRNASRWIKKLIKFGFLPALPISFAVSSAFPLHSLVETNLFSIHPLPDAVDDVAQSSGGMVGAIGTSSTVGPFRPSALAIAVRTSLSVVARTPVAP